MAFDPDALQGPQRTALHEALQSILHDVKNELAIGLGHLDFGSDSIDQHGSTSVRSSLLQIDRHVQLLQAFLLGDYEAGRSFDLVGDLVQLGQRLRRFAPDLPVLRDLDRVLASLQDAEVRVHGPRDAVHDLLVCLLASPSSTIRLVGCSLVDVGVEGRMAPGRYWQLRLLEAAAMPNLERELQRQRLVVCANGGDLRREGVAWILELAALS